MANAEQGSQGTEEQKKPSTERVMAWKRNNRDKWNAYMRDYNAKTGNAREGNRRRRHANMDKAREQAREGMRSWRARQKQQQIAVFPPNEQQSG